jgi:hypothetical protein
MKSAGMTCDMQEVHRRAAEIRVHWSATEKRRRMGLPPDVPAKIRSFIMSPRVVNWSPR